ncbi:PAS domain S-box protein, partial [Streptomyces sp. NPDC002057]
KKGNRVPVDLTTAPVRDGDQLVGAVMTFTDRRPYEQLEEEHAAELAARAQRSAAEREEQAERYAALAARHAQLTAALAESLRHRQNRLVTHPGGPRQHDAAVALVRHPTTLGTLVAAGIDKATELTGPHRTEFTVHAPPVIVALDPAGASTALGHLIADASGAASSAKFRLHGPAMPPDTTVEITAALRDNEVRIEIYGPRAVNDPTHLLVARDIIDAHGGSLTAQEPARGFGLTYAVRIPHTPAPVTHLAHSPAPRTLESPVAGSWIIGAAVSACRDRAGTALLGLPAPSTGHSSRPRLVPPAQTGQAASRTDAQPRSWEPVGGAPLGKDDADDAAQQRIAHLLSRIRHRPA